MEGHREMALFRKTKEVRDLSNAKFSTLQQTLGLVNPQVK